MNGVKKTIICFVIITGICGNALGATGYGISNIFTIDNRTGTGFRVSSIAPEYSGVFAKNVGVINEFEARIDWTDKTPSKVIFELNGLKKTVTTSNDTANVTFNMGTDLAYSTSGTKNELKVWAISSDESRSDSLIYNLWGLELPEWAVSLETKDGPINFETDQTGKIKFFGDVKLLKNRTGGNVSIPDDIPGIGGDYGVTINPLCFNWELAAQSNGENLSGLFALSGEWGAVAKCGKNREGGISASLGGKGEFYPDFKLTEVGAELAGNFEFDLPQVYLLCAWTGCCTDPCPYGQLSLKPELAGTVLLEQGQPELVAGMKFKDVELDLSILVKGVVGSKADKLYSLEGGIGGKPSITLQFPKNPDSYCGSEYIKEVSFVIIMEASAKIGWWESNWNTTFDIYRCPETGTLSLMSVESTADHATPEIISRDYLDSEEGYTVFAGGIDSNLQVQSESFDQYPSTSSTATGLPEPILNVGPLPHPSIAAENDSGLLLFVYDANKPTGKHQEIYFARWDGSQWSEHDTLTDNLNPDTNPAAAIDSSGNEIAVWMQAPEPNGSETGPRDIIGGFDILYSKYDAVAGEWQNPSQLTDNNYVDALPVFEKALDGSLRTIWMSSSSNAIPVWNDEHINPQIDVMGADWNGNAFGTPYIIASGLETSSLPSLCRTDTNEIMVYLKDHDNDTATSEDVDVVAMSRPLGGQWGQEVYLTSDNISDVSADVGVDSYGMPIAVWTKQMVPKTTTDGNSINVDQVWFSAYDQGQWSSPILAFEYKGISEPTFFRNQAGKMVLFWTAISDDFSDIYYSVFDSQHIKWTSPQQVTFDQGAETMISMTGSGGNILASYVKKRIDTSDPCSPPVIGASDIYLLQHEPEKDISLTSENIEFAPAVLEYFADFSDYWLYSSDDQGWNEYYDFIEDEIINFSDYSSLTSSIDNWQKPLQGETFKIIANINTSGDFIVQDVNVNFYEGDPCDGGTLIGSNKIDTLIPGKPKSTEIVWKSPSDRIAENIFVQVDPNRMIDESNEDNNLASQNAFELNLISKPPVFIRVPGAERVIIGLEVKNSGSGDAVSVPYKVQLNDINGEVIYEDQFDKILAGQTTSTQFEWDVSTLSEGNYQLSLKIDPNNTFTESNETDNNSVNSIPVLPDLKVEQWSLNVDSNSSALVKNIGPKPSDPNIIQLIYNSQALGANSIPALASMDSSNIDINISESITNGRVEFKAAPGTDPNSEVSLENNTAIKLLVNMDFDDSGYVDFYDLFYITNNWLLNEPSADIAPSGGDGIIDFRDFAEIADNWQEKKSN